MREVRPSTNEVSPTSQSNGERPQQFQKSLHLPLSSEPRIPEGQNNSRRTGWDTTVALSLLVAQGFCTLDPTVALFSHSQLWLRCIQVCLWSYIQSTQSISPCCASTGSRCASSCCCKEHSSEQWWCPLSRMQSGMQGLWGCGAFHPNF